MNIPKIVDPDADDSYSIKFDLDGAESFIKWQPPVLTIHPTNNQSHPRLYNIKIILRDNNPNPLQSIYNFRLNVKHSAQ